MKKKYDSKHELYFEWWLEEAKEAGLVKEWDRPDPVQLTEKVTLPFTKILKTKSREGEKHLMHPLTYQPDYVISWEGSNKLHNDMFCLTSESNDAYFLSQYLPENGNCSVVDIKPDRINRNQQHSYYTFPLNQKLMWAIYDTYVQKVVLYPASNSNFKKSLFQRTWTPRKYIEQEVYVRDCKWGKKGESKIKWEVRTIEQFLNG